VSIRQREVGDVGSRSIEEFIAEVKEKEKNKQ
jgi:threonyl-tRNA synthetase